MQKSLELFESKEDALASLLVLSVFRSKNEEGGDEFCIASTAKDCPYFQRDWQRVGSVHDLLLLK